MNKNKIILAISIICLTFIFTGSINVFGANCWVTRTWQCHDDYSCSDWECDNSDSGMFCTNWGRGPLFGDNATPPPPPPPPPVNGSCGAADGSNLFATPTSHLCASGNATAVSGNGSSANPWSWTCNGYNGGGNSRTCTANIIATSSVSCSVIPVCPTTVNVNENVTWSAIISGGVGTYTYSWIGDGFVNNKTTNTVSGSYTTPGIKNATVTVYDAASNPVVASCPTSCSVEGETHTGGRPGGGSIKITSNGVCNPAINKMVITSHLNPAIVSTLCSNGALDSFEIHLAENFWTDTTSWSWICKGLNPSLGDVDVSCDSSLNPLDVDSKSLDCSVSLVPYTNQVSINNNTVWKSIASTSPRVIWKVEDTNGASYPVEASDTLNKIFTTTGLKVVTAKIASTTLGVFGLPCSATTTVVQSGIIREQ